MKKQAKLLGYFMTSNHIAASDTDWNEHDEGNETYHFVVLLDNQYYEFTSEYSYGSCYSGYCGASWGHTNRELKPISNFTLAFKSKEDIFISVEDLIVDVEVLDYEQSYCTVITVKTTDGRDVVSETGDGGCHYYSSGQVIVNEELFKL